MPSPEPLSEADRRRLLEVARASIDYGLTQGRPLPVSLEEFPAALREAQATFVTLEVDHRLRGCIGSLEPHLPLVEDVARHAFDAAFRDPRFPPVTPDEVPRLEIHLSVLSPHQPVAFGDESELLRQLRPGIDGLLIACGQRRATFLPSVWESLPEPAQFLAHLKLKAGIAEVPAGERLRAWRYTTESFGEPAGPPGSPQRP
jgi:hypothetical protein